MYREELPQDIRNPGYTILYSKNENYLQKKIEDEIRDRLVEGYGSDYKDRPPIKKTRKGYFMATLIHFPKADPKRPFSSRLKPRVSIPDDAIKGRLKKGITATLYAETEEELYKKIEDHLRNYSKKDEYFYDFLSRPAQHPRFKYWACAVKYLRKKDYYFYDFIGEIMASDDDDD